jgi:predicted AlkP superfamily pyrophosphatase or phosphodiesterase
MRSPLQFRFVDEALGKFLNELRMRRIDEKTLVIVSAKHGQSPIRPQPAQGDLGRRVWLDPRL